MKLRVLLTALIVASILPARVAGAQIIIVGEDRRASASSLVAGGGETDHEQHTEVAPDVGPFESSLFADAVLPEAEASAVATQISVLTGSFLRAEGTAHGSAEVFAEAASAYGSAQSNVAVRFTLLQPSAFSLVGFLEAEGAGTMTVQLSRPFETVVWASAVDQRIDLAEDGALEADTYDLNITCGATGSVSAPGESQIGTGRYDIVLGFGQSTDAPVLAAPGLAAFPNPFRESTRLTVPEGTREVRILDARGRVVRTLGASASLLFDGRDAAGRALASGVYWVEPVGAAGPAVKLVRLR